MLSVICAIPCSQAEFTLPPCENNLKLQGKGVAGLCLGRSGRRLGGLRAFWRCYGVCGAREYRLRLASRWSGMLYLAVVRACMYASGAWWLAEDDERSRRLKGCAAT